MPYLDDPFMTSRSDRPLDDQSGTFFARHSLRRDSSWPTQWVGYPSAGQMKRPRAPRAAEAALSAASSLSSARADG